MCAAQPNGALRARTGASPYPQTLGEAYPFCNGSRRGFRKVFNPSIQETIGREALIVFSHLSRKF
jgi:hypothetical protein